MIGKLFSLGILYSIFPSPKNFEIVSDITIKHDKISENAHTTAPMNFTLSTFVPFGSSQSKTQNQLLNQTFTLPTSHSNLSSTLTLSKLNSPSTVSPYVSHVALNVSTPIGGTTSATSQSVCGTQLCQNDEVCVAPLSGASLCVKRLSDRRYCVDNPCSTGMKCFDNVTSKAYTCYMKLDGTVGECMGIQCSPGDVCYQIMGQQAKCIQFNQAPKCLGQNEEFSPCKSGCESTCTDPSPTCMNSSTCTPGCSCIRGYVRLNGLCELMSKCGSTTTGNVTCSGNEIYTPCKSPCEKTCSGVPSAGCSFMGPVLTTTVNPKNCSPGCVCMAAYKRDVDNGQCIHARQCYQTTTCSPNESWSRCHNCEPVCGQTKNPSCKTCWSGCGCNQGYSRNSKGLCVLTSECKL